MSRSRLAPAAGAAAGVADPARPRTLADQLRGWDEGRLRELLTARPDLAVPAPQDSSQLASRAGTRASVARAVDRLDRLGLTVLGATWHAAPVSQADLRALVHAEPAAVDATVEQLRALALVWGDRDALRVPSVVGEVVGGAGLGPDVTSLLSGRGPARVATLLRDLGLPVSGDAVRDAGEAAAHLAGPGVVAGLLAEVDERARTILDHLDREGREGATENGGEPVDRSTASSPVDQLVARGLLLPRDRRHLVVPREVGIALRGGRTTHERVDERPELATDERPTRLADRAAAGAAFEATRQVQLLLEHWGAAPPGALRGGGLGVRDLRAAADLLHVEPAVAALLVELAVAGGLLAVGSTDQHDGAWLPTEAFDVWAAADPADRWSRLALAWLHQSRLSGLVGSRREGKPVNALADGLERGWLVETRLLALRELAEVPGERALAAGTGVASLVARTDWLRPRRPRERERALAWLVDEASVLGVLGLGALSSPGRSLLGRDPAHDAAAVLAPLLPESVDHVLLQADLTAVAPGPLTQQLAHDVALLGDVESRGGATVYRFSEASVRRAFDSGWSSGEVHAFLAGSSRTPVPQALSYLVDDVARRFGTVRVGAVESFLRSDDEAALTELVHHPRAATLRLRRIAPTVVVSDVSLDVLLPRLRELGTAPVVEAPDGTVRLARREVHRAPTPHRRGNPGLDPVDPHGRARSAARVAATVTAIRAGDRAGGRLGERGRERTGDRAGTRGAASAAPRAPALSAAATLAVLREAVEQQRTVWIAYVDNDGVVAERVVDPVRVEAGRLTAYDHRGDDQRGFAVHRIHRVHLLDDDG